MCIPSSTRIVELLHSSPESLPASDSATRERVGGRTIAIMEAVTHRPTSAADLSLDKHTSSRHRPIWTKVLRVRQLLGPLKAPSNNPYDDSPSRGAGNSLCESSPVGPTARGVHVPWFNDAASLQHGPKMSPPTLELPNNGSQDFQHSKTSTATPSTSTDPTTIASTAPSCSPENAGALLTPSNCLSEIAFDEAFSENLCGDVYMDKKALIDNSLIQRWDHEIRGKLDQDLKGLIEGHSGRAGHILFNNQFYMAGAKRGSVLLAEPTIIITCGIKKSGKKIAEQLEKLKLHYLEEFGQPIQVRYQRAPSYWAASSTLETATNDPTSTPIYRGWRFDQVGVESKVHSAETTTTCGLKLEFVLQNKDSVRRRYASFGGLVLIGKVIFCMTTAHTFMLDDDEGASDQDEDASGNSNYDSDADMDRDFAPGSSDLTNTKPSFSGTMWHSKLNPASAYSFDGKKTLVKQDGSVINSKTPNSDWALFSLSSFLPLSNRNGSLMLLSVTPEILLSAGNVILLCGAEERYLGYLTQTHLSIHTIGGELDVREIVLSNPLTSGASGSWIVRESQVCGYVVAVTNAGRSCLMLPMERAFADIETTFGQSVTIGHELNDAVQKERRQAQQKLEAASIEDVHQVSNRESITRAYAHNETALGRRVMFEHEFNDAVRKERRQALLELEAARIEDVHQVSNRESLMRAYAHNETALDRRLELIDAVRKERRQASLKLEAARIQDVHQVCDSTSTNADADADNGMRQVPAASGPTLEAIDQGVSNQHEPGCAEEKEESPGNLHQGTEGKEGVGNPNTNDDASHTPAIESKNKRRITAFFATCVRGVRYLVCCGLYGSKNTSLDAEIVERKSVEHEPIEQAAVEEEYGPDHSGREEPDIYGLNSPPFIDPYARSPPLIELP